MKRRSKLFSRKSPSEIVLYSIIFLIFSAFALSYIYMILWCAYQGMRDLESIAHDPFGFSKPQLKNYIDVFSIMEVNGSNYFRMLLNSLYFSFLGPLLCMTVTSMMAYVTARYTFFGSKWVYFIVLVVITMPLYGSGTAMYKLLYNTGIINSRWMILTSLNAFSIYYMYFYAFYRGLSKSYSEAAEIDGANKWQIYFKIMFPQAITMFGSLFLLLWITDWNNYSGALLYLSKLPTLAVGIYVFNIQMQYDSKPHILYAGCTIALLPPLIIFICFNSSLMSNVSLGGIKE